MSVEFVEPRVRGREVASWGAVYAMTLCVGALIASEFMPVSLLTPIAHYLGLTEGQAGQAISISGIFAVLTSLLISPMTSRIDRRAVLLSLTGVMTASGAAAAIRAIASIGITWPVGLFGLVSQMMRVRPLMDSSTRSSGKTKSSFLAIHWILRGTAIETKTGST